MGSITPKESGFTLIELLVVVAIIGILAAIAIPQFAAYKTRSFNARAETDLRNAITAQEAYFVDHEDYLSCQTGLCIGSLPGISTVSDGVHVAFSVYNPTSGPAFYAASCHERGDVYWYFDSAGNSGTGNGTIVSSSLPGDCTDGAMGGLLGG